MIGGPGPRAAGRGVGSAVACRRGGCIPGTLRRVARNSNLPLRGRRPTRLSGAAVTCHGAGCLWAEYLFQMAKCVSRFVLSAAMCIVLFKPASVDSSAHTVILGRVGAFYNFAMETNPVFLHCVQGGAVAACGDFISQKLQAWTKSRDKPSSDINTPVSSARLLKASGTGIAFNGLLIQPGNTCQ